MYTTGVDGSKVKFYTISLHIHTTPHFTEKGYLAKEDGAYLKPLGTLGNPNISGMRWCAKQRDVVDNATGQRVKMPETRPKVNRKRKRVEFEAGDQDTDFDGDAEAILAGVQARLRNEESMTHPSLSHTVQTTNTYSTQRHTRRKRPGVNDR